MIVFDAQANATLAWQNSKFFDKLTIKPKYVVAKVQQPRRIRLP
jgi:hypothetical protein